MRLIDADVFKTLVTAVTIAEGCKAGDCTVCAFDKALDIVKAGEVNG